MDMKSIKIALIGGHVTPVLAVLDEFKKKINDGMPISIIFIGRKYISFFEKTETLEYKEISKRGVPFRNLMSGRFTRVLSFRSIIEMFLVPYGLLSSFFLLIKERPTHIISFGGYLGLPICLAAYIIRIPVFVHEQTINPGITNRFISKLAKKIFVSFPQSLSSFPPEKTIFSGNPIRESTLRIDRKPFDVPRTKPVIYVTGGSLGSHSINILIESILVPLLKKYTLIHQTGVSEKYKDFERLSIFKKKLPIDLQSHYYLRHHFSSDEIGYIYSVTDLIIGRSGANTFFEAVKLSIPAIFIPLPWSAGNEQQKHADIFESLKLGKTFNQDHKAAELITLIESTVNNLGAHKNSFTNLDKLYLQNGASILVNEVISRS